MVCRSFDYMGPVRMAITGWAGMGSRMGGGGVAGAGAKDEAERRLISQPAAPSHPNGLKALD